jgi:hypothetical protein
MPPAPPGESPREAVNRTRLIAEALVELGEGADAVRLVKHLQSRHGVVLVVEEVELVRRELLERAKTPPGPDQPPPEAAARPAYPRST